jgi:cysteinyl-tRNA synthetase
VVAELTKSKMRGALEDDMNTAQALAAVFDMVREVNTAADAGQLSQQDVPALLSALADFDSIFDVLRDDDSEKSRAAFLWAKEAGKLSAEQAEEIAHQLSDSQVEELVAERTRAKRAKDFARSDAIRKTLADGGIVVEDTKDGVRWKRK